MLHVRSVEYRGGHRLRLAFTDGAEGEVDLGPHLNGPVFAPLREPAVFAQVYIDRDVHTIAWPNGADFAPEFLRDLLRSGVAAA
jgi:Protein of unknown function (DUF2442)